MIDTRTLRAELAAWLTAGGFNAYPRIQAGYTSPAVFVGQPLRVAPRTASLDELELELVLAVGNPSNPDAQDEAVELAVSVLERFRPHVLDMSAFTAARSIRAAEAADFGESNLGTAVLTATIQLTILA